MGHSFLTYDINTNSGKPLTVGLRSTGSGDAETQLNVLKEIFEDISDFSSDKSFFSKTFSSIKNLMSDRCTTQKKFNRMFSEYRNSIIPDITENWAQLSQNERDKLSKVNEFFCSLNLLWISQVNPKLV